MATSSRKLKKGFKAKLIKSRKALRSFKATARKAELLSAGEREELILEYRLKARSLAHSILRRWHSRLDGQEVESIVDLSLCEAVRRYNKRKASFITFLFYHLRGNLIRAVATAASLNFVPLPDFDSMDSGLDRNGTSRARVANAMEIADTFCNHDYEAPDAVLLKKEISNLSADACAKLDPLEREVVQRIYLQEEQLMDIAKSLGYSRCHISRVKRKAIETLHRDLAPSIYPEGAPNPDFDEDEKQPVFRARRRVVYRRRPRSGKVVESHAEALVANAY